MLCIATKFGLYFTDDIVVIVDQRRSLPWRRHRMTDSHSGLSSAPQSSGRGGAGNIHTHPAPNERACTSDTPDKNRHRKPHPSPSPRKASAPPIYPHVV